MNYFTRELITEKQQLTNLELETIQKFTGSHMALPAIRLLLDRQFPGRYFHRGLLHRLIAENQSTKKDVDLLKKLREKGKEVKEEGICK